MRKLYTSPEMEIIEFDTKDVDFEQIYNEQGVSIYKVN